MEADLILQALEGHLGPKIAAAGGVLSVADNPWDVVDLLKVTPEKWRVILSFEDEEAAQERCPGGWTAGTFVLYIQIHKGFEAKRGTTIHRPTPAARVAMTRRCAQVRAWMRAIQFPANADIAEDDASAFAFTGAEWLDGKDMEDRPWRVRRMDFQLIYALDDPALDPDPDGTQLTIAGGFAITGVAADPAFYIISNAGQAVGRVPRFAPDPADPAGTGSGWRITGLSPEGDFYLVCLSGLPDGRIPAFIA